MAIDINTTFTNTDGNPFPDTSAINASGPTATDGTEFVKVMVDNFLFGPQQSLLNFAGLIPDGIPEADGASQELEALKKSFGNPGEAVDWYGTVDPATLGLKMLLLEGQGVLIANYQELTDVVYVGDGNNPTAIAFYKADDAAGTIRNTAGTYLILPDAVNVYPRFQAESVFSARITGAGVVTSESSSFISAVAHPGTGLFTLTWNTDLFGVAPSVVVTPDTNANTANTELITAASGFVRVYSSAPALIDTAFQIHVQRQETDYLVYPANFLRGAVRY